MFILITAIILGILLLSAIQYARKTKVVGFGLGCVCSLLTYGIFQDIIGKTAYINLVDTYWGNSSISFILEIVFLIIVLAILYCVGQITKNVRIKFVHADGKEEVF